MTDNTITVTGHAQVHVAPTVATWHLTIEVTDREARVAYARCAEQAASIIEQALADARRRAERLTAAAGRALGPIVSIETRDEDYFPHVAELRSGGAPGMPVEVPAIEVNQSVTVVFALGD
jgi:uncharacterized protein YggE